MRQDSGEATGFVPEWTSSETIAGERSKDRHVPGEPGLWILLGGDIAIFSVLFVVFLHARGAGKRLFAASQHALHVDLGALNTLILLTSSLLLVWAVRACRVPSSSRWAAPLAFAAAVVGSCFVVVKVLEYRSMVSSGLTPATNEFFMYYYVLTGLHLFHVCIGLCVLLAVFVVTLRPGTSTTRMKFIEGGACFWHMVDLLWVVIFPIVFLVR